MARFTARLCVLLTSLILTTSLRADPGTSPATGLVSYWSFENNLGDVGDLYSSGSGTVVDDLTAQRGSARFVAGKVGRAVAMGQQVGDPLWFSGPDSADVDITGAYTIEAWIYPTLFDESWQRLVLRWQGQFSFHFALRLVGGVWNVSLFHQQADGATNVNADGGAVQLNQWQHVAGVADATHVRVYLDGVEVASVPYDGTLHSGTGVGLGVGDMAGGDGLRFNGYLDELAIWSVALSPAEILSHFEAGPDGYGLTLSCEEEIDGVLIDGPGLGSVGEATELTASMTGLDEGQAASYQWSLVDGDATLGPTDAATLSVTPTAAGTVVVEVAAGDGLCTDRATATFSMQVLPGGGPGSSPALGLVSYYRFDGSSADNGADFIHHSGVNADSLAPQGGSERFVPGVIGEAVAIGAQAGDAVWLRAPASADVALPATYTIETWIYPTDLTGLWQRLALRWGSPVAYHFALRAVGGSWMVSLFHGQAGGATPNADGGAVVLKRWQHVAGVADGSFLRVYLDGVEVASTPYDGTINEGGTEGLGIADSFAGAAGMSFNGYVDELAMWNVALTPEQLLSHYEAGPAGYGLTEGCLEEPDTVTVSGLAYGPTGGSVELTAIMGGVDPSRSPTYTWEILEGDATLTPVDEDTVTVDLGAAGFVDVGVSAGDGACDDIAATVHRIQVLAAGGPGSSPEDGLVSYWSFDATLEDEGGDRTCSAGVTHDDLTPAAGIPRHVPGVIGGAVALGETAEDTPLLLAASSPDVELPSTYTIEAWIYPTELSDSWQRLVLRWGGAAGLHSYHFALRNNGGFVNAVSLFHGQANAAEVSANGGTVLPGQWQHVAAVADGSMIRVYLDGAQVDAVAYDGTITQGTAEGLGIGDSFSAQGTIRYNGLLDELAIWNVALTPEQILSHAAAGVDGYGLDVIPPTLQLAGDCNQDGGRDVSDLICNVRLLFQGFYLLDRSPQAPPCAGGSPQDPGNVAVLDVNGDGRDDVSDVVYMASFLFLGGSPPAQGLECMPVPFRRGCPTNPGCP